jgi:hypothetical protein
VEYKIEVSISGFHAVIIQAVYRYSQEFDFQKKVQIWITIFNICAFWVIYWLNKKVSIIPLFIFGLIHVGLWSTQVIFTVSMLIKKDMLVFGSRANLGKWKTNFKIQLIGVLIPFITFTVFMIFFKK